MNSQYQNIVEQAQLLAAEMPASLVSALAEAFLAIDLLDWPSARSRALQGISNPHYRALAAGLVDSWRMSSPDVSPQSVALALSTAAASEKAHLQSQSIDLVWTGPDTRALPVRQTEQVLLQLIGSAEKRLLLVSYAVYKIPRICESIVQAARRGAKVTIIVENPERRVGKETYNTLRALGPEVAERCQVYLWPLENRQKDASGRQGILHVKCAAADGRLLFLSSANLTEYAFSMNMELGIFIGGGNLPVQVENLFGEFVDAGLFTRA